MSSCARRFRKAELVTADGMSVVWASRLVGKPLKQRVTGIDLFERLVGHAARRGLSVYFLGARDASVRGVVRHFTSRFPDLRVAGYRNGYFDSVRIREVADEIRRSRADLLIRRYGVARSGELDRAIPGSYGRALCARRRRKFRPPERVAAPRARVDAESGA